MNRLILFICLVSFVAANAFADITPQTFQSAQVGNETLFVVTFETPPDILGNFSRIPANAGFDSPISYLPRLIGNSPWEVQAYLELNKTDRYADRYSVSNDSPRQLSYVGKMKPAASGKYVLRLEYPATNRSWKTEAVLLDLHAATALPMNVWGETNQAQSTAAQSPASAVPPNTPLQRFGLAQKHYLEHLHHIYGDVGGFFSFAAEQTKRKYNLPAEQTSGVFLSPSAYPMSIGEALFSTTTGALALQESLQLDRMLHGSTAFSARPIDIKTIVGVNVASHPFDAMREGKTPKYRTLATYIPSTNYYLAFDRIDKLFKFFDFLNEWGSSFLELQEPVSNDFQVRSKLHEQLCLPGTIVSRLVPPALVSHLAITGSDPFLREGSDLTILFEVRDKETFSQVTQLSFDAARAKFPDAKYQQEIYDTVEIESLRTATRNISCYRAWFGNVAIYSNSAVALKRVLDTKTGKTTSLTDTADFKYMRAVIYPLDEKREDGFLYLSDDFIRHLVSPELRIKEKRRVEIATSLKLLTNAFLFYGYEHGPGSTSIDELARDRALEKHDLDTSDGGIISWDKDLKRAVSANYGALSFLTPLIELPISQVSTEERRAYEVFRNSYQNYWRRYFDPVGIRIKLGKTIHFDVTILPLIQQSRYAELKDLARGRPISVDISQFPQKTSFRLVSHLNPESVQLRRLKSLAGGLLGSQAMAIPGSAPTQNPPTLLDWIGEYITVWGEDSDQLTAFLKRQYEAADSFSQSRAEFAPDLFETPLVLGVQATNPLAVAAFLLSFRAMLQSTAPNLVLYNNLAPYKGVTIVEIAPDPQGALAGQLRQTPGDSSSSPASSVGSGPRLYYETIGDAFYVSTQAQALRNLIDSGDKSTVLTKTDEKTTTIDTKFRSHVFLYLAPRPANKLSASAAYVLEQRARQASLRNMGQVWVLGRSGIVDGDLRDELAAHFLGYRLVCPAEGTYHYDAKSDLVTNSIYGSMLEPIRRETLPPDSRLVRFINSVDSILGSLLFTKEGMQTIVEIRREKE